MLPDSQPSPSIRSCLNYCIDNGFVRRSCVFLIGFLFTLFVAQAQTGILTPNSAGVAVGAGYFPLERAFDGQPTWDDVAGSPTGGTGGLNAPALGSRYGYIDLGPAYADLRVTEIWTQYISSATGDQTPYEEVWWDDDNDNVNDNGILTTDINFNSATGLTTSAASRWVRDKDHSTTPVTPPLRYLILKNPATMTGGAMEYAIVGYNVSSAPPVAPSTLSTLATSSSVITLNWVDNSNNETGFEVHRSATPGGPYALLATTASNVITYDDTGLTPSTTYYYVIRAVNTAGNSTFTTEVSESTPTANLQKIYVNFADAALASSPSPWNHFTTSGSSQSSLMNLLDDQGSSTNITLVQDSPWSGATTAGGMTTGIYPSEVRGSYIWTDNDPEDLQLSGLDPAVRYNFEFFGSRDKAGNRTTGYAIRGTLVELQAEFNTSNTVRIEQVSPEADGSLIINVTRESGGIVAYLNAMIIEADISALTPPMAPDNLLVANTAYNQIGLSWTDQSNNERGFEVYRSTTAGGPYALVTTTAANVTSYDDIGLIPSTTYYYVIRSVNAVGNSTYTPEVTTTTLSTSLQLIYVNFADVSLTSSPSPWNHFTSSGAAGTSLTNLQDAKGVSTNLTIAQQTAWTGAKATGGMVTGILPSVVRESYLWTDNDPETLRLSGLDPTATYNFIFFNSRNKAGNRTTGFTIGGTQVSLQAEFNATNTVRIDQISANPDGTLDIMVARTLGGIVAYLNAMIIEVSLPANQGTVSDLAEITALRDLYNDTNGAGWTNSSGWPATPSEWDAITSVDQIVGWHGVTTSGGDITTIDLRSNNLTGPLPSSIGGLTALSFLYLLENSLSGTIPSSIGDLTRLRGLSMRQNNLTGVIPSSIGNLILLEGFEANDNQLSGPIPVEIGNLTALTSLTLRNNHLSGLLPAELGQLTALRYLFLNHNQLTGSIPGAMGGMIRLISMVLNNNSLSGNIPPELAMLGSLQSLNLSNNQLSGSIPIEFGQLTTLTTLQLESNDLTGFLPDELSNLQNLGTIRLGSNHLTGDLPSGWASNANISGLFLAFNHFTSFPDFSSNPNAGLMDVNIQSNYIPQSDIDANLPGGTPVFNSFTYSPQKTLNGLVPDEVEILALRDFYESTNGMNWVSQTDADPANDWPSTNAAWDAITSVDQMVGWYGLTTFNGDVTEIIASDNNMSGSMPASLGDLRELKTISLGLAPTTSNTLTGEIPSRLGALAKLEVLILSGNDLSGTIPPELFEISTLKDVVLSNNQLSGTLPATLGQAINLESLTLPSNNLTGALPASIGNLTKLKTIYLESNGFNGSLPVTIGQLPDLRYLNLANNNFSGRLPDELTQCTLLNTMYLHQNNFSGELPASFGDLTSLHTLFLNNNKFTGNLPSSFSQLIALRSITLHNNNFTGPFPAFDLAGQVYDMNIADNQFSSIPYFERVDELRVQGNLLTFESLEAQLADGTPPRVFTYAPQNVPSGQTMMEAYLNESLLLVNARSGGAQTTYQWQEWNGTTWQNLNGETTAQLNLSNIVIDDDGRRLRCEMSNVGFPGLILFSEEYQLNVIISQTFYVIANGNWSDPAIWSLTEGGAAENRVPTEFDNVQLSDYQVEITADVDCRSVRIDAGPGTELKIAGKQAGLTVNGQVLVNNSSAVDNKIVKVVNGGRLECR